MLSKEELLKLGLNAQVEHLHESILELEKKISTLISEKEEPASGKGNKRRTSK